MFGNVAAIGLEIEGPWTARVPVEGFIRDFHDEYMPRPADDIDLWLKECVSVPLKHQAQVEAFFDQIEPHWYDQGIMDGMGFHIHFSFVDPKHYDLALSPKFVQELSAKLFDEFRDDERLQRRPAYRSQYGSNFYKMEYPPEYWLRNPVRDPRDGRQADGRKNRYYMVNFWRAHEAHGTFEIRILPANTIDQMKRYVQWVLNFINEYLENHATEYNVKITKNVVVNKDRRVHTIRSGCKDLEEDIELIPCEKQYTHKILGDK